MTDPVLLQIDGPVATVTLNRPERRNAVNAELCAAMIRAFGQIEADPAIRATILTGAGAVFCAGMDLKAFSEGHGDAILFGPHGFAGFVKRQRTKPVIAAVQGAALAGGFEVMLACDMVIAATDATFGLPEAQLGLIAGAGGVMRLAQRIPRVRANEILLTGSPIDAQTAFDLGLLNAVLPADDVLPLARALATRIAANAPRSITESLTLSDAAFRATENWAENDQTLSNIGTSEDAREGTTAFLEKRKPNWSGQ